MAKSFELCTCCVLPVRFPGISFDSSGVCNFCRAEVLSDQTKFLNAQRQEFDETVTSLRGRFRHDALCCYSGGKDSTFMLKMMVRDLGLSVFAYTLDNGFITTKAKENILRVVEALGVDHIFFRPSTGFMRRLYIESMLGDLNKGRGAYERRISDACLSCISLVNVQGRGFALQMKIPMIFAGFTPGQVPKAVLKNSYRHQKETYAAHKAELERALGADVEKYYFLAEDDFDVYQMSPFIVYEKSEDEILAGIRELGWEYPENLDGCSSNCALNAVGNIAHEAKFGFHPYAFELSKLVRRKLLTREEALKKLHLKVEDREIDQTLGRLGITRQQLSRRRLPKK